MDKYVAYCAVDGEYETFKTFEAARKWLIDDADHSEGIPEESMDGFDYIAKITHRTKFVETESAKDYWKYEGEEGWEDKEEWPYDNEFDFVGKLIMEETDA